MAKSFKAVIKKNGNFITNINKDVLVAGVHGSKMKKEDLLADVDDVLVDHTNASSLLLQKPTDLQDATSQGSRNA